MKKVLTDNCHVPVKMWLDELEPEAMQQTLNLANLPFAFRHIAILPDAHSAYGMPIGGVLATREVIIPNAVGVDIGCGMCAIRTNLEDIKTEKLKLLMAGIRSLVPLGFNHHKKEQDENLIPSLDTVPERGVVRQEYRAALRQIGTLGGGNHFIEIQKGNDGHIWIMVHSGSRNIGLKVAEHYNKLAKKLNERWFSSVDRSKDLAFLPIESPEAKDYIAEMRYCVDFALANRQLMMANIKKIFREEIGNRFEDLQFINIAHNYAAWEYHFGVSVIVHRKGATSARDGELGIIPGSQGTKSYIVIGKGNPESFQSCSHGAGRMMGRKQAQRSLDLETEISKLDKKGIIHSIRTVKDLDEAPSAYKDIDEVMANQKDLVDIAVELTPMAVIKG